jgi:hypothetical protein
MGGIPAKGNPGNYVTYDSPAIAFIRVAGVFFLVYNRLMQSRISKLVHGPIRGNLPIASAGRKGWKRWKIRPDSFHFKVRRDRSPLAAPVMDRFPERPFLAAVPLDGYRCSLLERL